MERFIIKQRELMDRSSRWRRQDDDAVAACRRFHIHANGITDTVTGDVTLQVEGGGELELSLDAFMSEWMLVGR